MTYHFLASNITRPGIHLFQQLREGAHGPVAPGAPNGCGVRENWSRGHGNEAMVWALPRPTWNWWNSQRFTVKAWNAC